MLPLSVERIKESATARALQVAYVTLGGSHRFGYATDKSDYDIRVIGVPSQEYFVPGKRLAIVGFDSLDNTLYNSIANTTILENEVPKKVDLFIDPISNFFKQAFSGQYFQLYNLCTLADELSYSDPIWNQYHAKFIDSVPPAAYYTSALTILRDLASIRHVQKEYEQDPYKAKKKYLQLRVVTDFITTKKVTYNYSYKSVRNQELPWGTFLQLTEKLSTDLSCVTKPDYRDTRDSVMRFKRLLAEFMNTWYGEELFTLK